MERLDKNLLSSGGAAPCSAALPPEGRRLVSPPGRDRPLNMIQVTLEFVWETQPSLDSLVRKTTRRTKSPSRPLMAGDDGAFMTLSWLFGGWRRRGQGESEVSCCLVSQVKALSQWKQDWTRRNPTCLRLFSIVENVVNMSCSNTVSYKYTNVV